MLRVAGGFHEERLQRANRNLVPTMVPGVQNTQISVLLRTPLPLCSVNELLVSLVMHVRH